MFVYTFMLVSVLGFLVVVFLFRSATHDGSFVSYDAQESPSVKKLQEHANNIRKAVEERHNKSADEEKRFIS